eukprot:scaffold3404_cov15-Tisochrysis_lutea.AAC.1
MSGPAGLHARERDTSGELSTEEASHAAVMAAATEHGAGAKRGATSHPGEGASLLQNGHQVCVYVRMCVRVRGEVRLKNLEGSRFDERIQQASLTL